MALIRGLRWLLLLGLVALVVGIAFSLSGNGRPSPLASSDEPARPAALLKRIAQKSSHVEMVRTRRGTPTLRMQARDSTTYTNGHLDLTTVVFHLFAPDGQETVVEAPSAEMIPVAEEPATPPPGAAPRQSGAGAAEEDVGSWVLSGGVKVTAADGLTMAMPTLNYDESQGQARTADPVSFTRGNEIGSSVGMVYDVAAQNVRFLQQVQASMPLGSMGLVRIETASASHDLGRKRFETKSYRATTERGETLSGGMLTAMFHQDGGLDRLEGSDGFVLESTHAISAGGAPASPLSQLLALGGSRTMRGQRLAVVFNGAPEPATLEVSGQANLIASDVNGSGAPASIAAQTLTFDLIHGNLSHAHATGSVDLQGAPAAGQTIGFRLKSNELDAVVDPNLGSISNLEGVGEIHLTDQDMESQGSRTVLDPNSNIVTLTGRDGELANATWLERKIQAQRIEVDRKRKTLSARGGVRASYVPPPAQPGDEAKEAQPLPFFRGGETIYAMAGSLTFADQGKVAHYRDRVRLWQGDNRVEASEVDLNETSGTLEARGDVISTFRQPPSQADGSPPAAAAHNPSDDIVTVAAATMKYDRAANIVSYTGRVLVTQAGMRVTSDTQTVTLAAGGGSAERMEATGNVDMKEQDRTGRGDRLVVDLKTNTMKLFGIGREAIVQDESGQQVVRGSSLTMDRSGDKILVESQLGGRTWITLKPRQKGAPGLVSDPHN